MTGTRAQQGEARAIITTDSEYDQRLSELWRQVRALERRPAWNCRYTKAEQGLLHEWREVERKVLSLAWAHGLLEMPEPPRVKHEKALRIVGIIIHTLPMTLLLAGVVLRLTGVIR